MKAQIYPISDNTVSSIKVDSHVDQTLHVEDLVVPNQSSLADVIYDSSSETSLSFKPFLDGVTNPQRASTGEVGLNLTPKDIR